MENIKKYIEELCSVMTVSGFEHRNKEKILSLGKEIFDETITDSVGSYLFVKRSKKENAPRILIDAHIDEIGFMVTEICEGGFLKFTSVGGLDAHVLQGAEVNVYGKEKIFGIITSTPPHLLTKETRNNLEKIEQLYIDTGYSEETLEKLIPVGSPASFCENCISLSNNIICGHGFDNKVCCASAFDALSGVSADELAFDVYLLLSCREEYGGFIGAQTGADRAQAEFAVSLDVNFARAPEIDETLSVKMGDGYSVSISAVTSRKFTKKIIELSKRNGLPYQPIAEPNNVGTNGNVLGLTNLGIPCVDLGIPLGSMHTFSESASLCDCKALSRLLSLIVCDTSLATEVCNARKN
ncbi:MAG: M42 family metallopeptidase [Ruminococcaceae bacterium]|nr:M42 family metallopeptidase [Oscillospiraceae bacterium]